MISGLAASVILFFILPKNLAATGSCIGMLLPFMVVPVVSKFTQPVSQETVAKAFAGN